MEIAIAKLLLITTNFYFSYVYARQAHREHNELFKEHRHLIGYPPTNFKCLRPSSFSVKVPAKTHLAQWTAMLVIVVALCRPFRNLRYYLNQDDLKVGVHCARFVRVIIIKRVCTMTRTGCVVLCSFAETRCFKNQMLWSNRKRIKSSMHFTYCDSLKETA